MIYQGKAGAPGRIRTGDLGIRNPLVYIKTYFSLEIRVDTVWTKSLKMTQFN